MLDSTRLKYLEQEVEQLRAVLYQAVGGKPTRLTHAAVMPISQELDALINQYQKEKNNREQ
ncbi:hypothetical protein GCM10011571_29050 [Marinithermofilum abyssi]|uniref:Spo0E like sporulation regulatory protein n=1 Tax=Marinithermofilum abyssi TaxID=1571185 RepID=A0A8J2VED2_9BACL|nr:aspartyl-phosphate phosphatase Spo0E family protein [Marinithermofilum abyssi]GGE25078.1 hypothetical protein GCM10011571_29050 [Marinithermofilum abyssi]